MMIESELKLIDYNGDWTMPCYCEIVVWIYDIYDNNFGIRYYFMKYLKERCW